MIQLDEETDPNSEASAAGFSTISALSRERIRRAGSNITLNAESNSESTDLGFRALRVDATNMIDLLRTPDDLGQDELDLFTGSVRPDRTGEDLLFQVLLDWGLELTMQIVVEQMGGQQVFIVEDGVLIACFDEKVSLDMVRQVAARTPLRAVFRDSSFLTDADRINAEQTFTEVSPSTDVKVI